MPDLLVRDFFKLASDNLIATLWTIVPFGIGILVILLGFKYGYTIFILLSMDETDRQSYYDWKNQ